MSAMRHRTFGRKTHSCVGANIFFIEEELWNGGPHKSSCVWWAIHEMVQGGRSKFLSRYYRQFVTADPIECRPSYAERNVEDHSRGSRFGDATTT